MAILVFSSASADAYTMGRDDVVVVTETGSLSGLYSSEGGLSLIIDGTVDNGARTDRGIWITGAALDADGNPDGFNQINVREGGVVYGGTGIDLGYQQYDSVTVTGKVIGRERGIWSRGDNVSINVTGEVSSDFVDLSQYIAMYIKGDWATIVNSGKISGGKTSLNLVGSESSYVDNSGEITGSITGLSGSGVNDFVLHNTGLIASLSTGTGQGVVIYSSSGVSLDNQGRIESEQAIVLSNASGEIENSGDLIGQRLGLSLNWFSGNTGQVSVANSGTIKGDTAIWVSSGALTLENSGRIVGKIQVNPDAQAEIINGGQILGRVTLGNADDIYRVTGTGYASKSVTGGGGNDRLTGGQRGETLRGGKDDDVLRGKGGDDTLNGDGARDDIRGGAGADTLLGGNGRDLLNGGKGNDILTGGTGADVFVFGPRSGSDRVTDFEAGKDVLRLVDQVGGFDALSLADTGTGLEITFDGGVILLAGLGGTSLTTADFDFV